jgi:hypothetical protein
MAHPNQYPHQPDQPYQPPPPTTGQFQAYPPQATPMGPPPGHHMAVTNVPVETNHVLHLILTILTCGFWGFVWIIVAAANSKRKKQHISYYH